MIHWRLHRGVSAACCPCSFGFSFCVCARQVRVAWCGVWMPRRLWDRRLFGSRYSVLSASSSQPNINSNLVRFVRFSDLRCPSVSRPVPGAAVTTFTWFPTPKVHYARSVVVTSFYHASCRAAPRAVHTGRASSRLPALRLPGPARETEACPQRLWLAVRTEACRLRSRRRPRPSGFPARRH